MLEPHACVYLFVYFSSLRARSGVAGLVSAFQYMSRADLSVDLFVCVWRGGGGGGGVLETRLENIWHYYGSFR